jgi:hypothetical protein
VKYGFKLTGAGEFVLVPYDFDIMAIGDVELARALPPPHHERA